MNEQLKPCPCGCEAKLIYVRGESYGLHLGEKYTSIKCSCCSFSANDVDDWNNRADGWILIDGAKSIPIGDWMVATCDKESEVATHIAKCRPNVIVIGGHFHFDMPKVYAYKEIGELPNPPKAASCGE